MERIADILKADNPEGSSQVGLFIPSKDRDGQEIDQEYWVHEGLRVVGQAFRGGTASPRRAGASGVVNDLATSAKTRAQVLLAVAEDSDLNSAEFNRAFVLMQYLGYLRRNSNDPQNTGHTGYDFWLTKLNQFNGNFINAEMVKAFISSIEYRQRFGP